MPQRSTSKLLVEQLEDRLTPSSTEIPAGQFNWTQYSPNGTLGQLLWEGQSLVYQTWNGSSWQPQTVAGGNAFTLPSYDTRDQMMTAAQTAQLVYTTNGAAHALVLDRVWNGQADGYQTLIRNYVQTGSGWVLANTITPPWVSYYGPNNLVAAAGPNNSISLIFTETSVSSQGIGQVGSGALYYATNQTGSWTFAKVAATADLSADIWIEGMQYAPRFLSLAVDPHGYAYVTYTPEFYVSGAFGTVDSTLMLATNASGAWQSQTVVAPINGGPADAGLGASVAIAPNGQVAVASYYVQRYSTGSPQSSWLDYSTLNPGGGWTTTKAVSTPDGYVAGDGPYYTGFDPVLSFDSQSQPTIVFNDEGAQHLPVTYSNAFAGQIRSTTLVNGSWQTTTIVPQTNPLVNQIFYPVATTFNGQTTYAGLQGVGTLDSNLNTVSVAFTPISVTQPSLISSPPVVPPPPASPPASPPPVTVPPVTVPPVVVPPVVVPPVVVPPVVPPPPPVSPPPVTVPPVTVPPVSPPPVTVPPVTVPPVTSPPLTSPPTTIPPPVQPVMAYGTASGQPSLVRVVYADGSTYSWTPFGYDFSGGDTVALADVNGDGVPDIIVASGPGIPGEVLVYDGATRMLLGTYTPMGTFSGGLTIAAGNIEGNGKTDIAVGVMGNGPPTLTVLDGSSGTLVDRFQPYPADYNGGFTVAVADVNHDGYADVVVAPNTNTRLVKVFSGQSISTGTANPQVLGSLIAFGAPYTGAVSVAVGDVMGRGHVDIVVGSASSSARVRVFDTTQLNPSLALTVPAFAETMWSDSSGIQVALVPSTTTPGQEDLIVTNGTGTLTALFSTSEISSSGWNTTLPEFFDPMAGIDNNGIYLAEISNPTTTGTPSVLRSAIRPPSSVRH